MYLREYPPRFGLELVRLWRDLTDAPSGTPELPERVPCAEQSFALMEFDDVWQEANMVSVCKWLRGSKKLEIPDSFRLVLPCRL